MGDSDMVFFGQPGSPCGAVKNDDRNNRHFTFELSKADAAIETIVLVYAIYGDDPAENLSHISGWELNISCGGERIMQYIPETIGGVKAMAACEIYRHNGEWKLKTVGRGYKCSLRELCEEFGVDIE